MPDTRRTGRPPLAEGDAQSAVVKFRIKPAGKQMVDQIAAARGITVTDAMREALADWCNKNLDALAQRR